jgi:hypothetical protein
VGNREERHERERDEHARDAGERAPPGQRHRDAVSGRGAPEPGRFATIGRRQQRDRGGGDGHEHRDDRHERRRRSAEGDADDHRRGRGEREREQELSQRARVADDPEADGNEQCRPERGRETQARGAAGLARGWRRQRTQREPCGDAEHARGDELRGA